MAAAYAALNSVMFILQQIQHHPRPPITIENQQMESLCQIISFLQDFLEKYLHRNIEDGKQEILESQIADAAYAAEDVIESHIVDQILAEKSSDYNLFCKDFQEVIQDMDLIKKEVIKIQEKIRGTDDDQLPRNIISMSANIMDSSTVPPPKRKSINTMVGFDDVLEQIMERLTGHPPNRQVLPIVGMGGIGKTTLARNVYDHQYIINQFHIRIWVTISQEYRIRDILLETLSCHQNDENKSSEDELGDQLYKSLCGRKYLIVLDDMWSIEAWEELKFFFPKNHNGSRIMITTRLSNVADHFDPNAFRMNFLDEDNSWDLFRKTVFPEDQCCPQELEETGKKIARNCKGLPLSIIVIGGFLANSEKTQQHWEYVAENLNAIVNLEDDKHCLNLLALSYNHLPVHLKVCFLYMGVYPEDSQISVSRLIKLWVAEGFLKPIAAKSMEEVAEEYLKDLIDRNLILVHKLGNSGKVKYCKIHDLLRDLCLREGERDKFLWVRTENDLEGILSQRRISIEKGASKENYHINRVLEDLQSASLARSLTCNFTVVRLPSCRFRLARVLNITYLKKYSFGDMLKFMNSRYLDFIDDIESRNKLTVFPSSIHLLWNLQTLFINGPSSVNEIHVPREIWQMSQLRHLEIGFWFSVSGPPNVPLIHEGDDFILRNLHTLKTVRNFKLSEEVTKRIPNIKRLKVCYLVFGLGEQCHYYCLNNLGLLNKLESLSIYDLGRQSLQNEFVHNFAFPNSLKKLSLCGTYLHWEDMRMIGSLPHLQVLKLKHKSFHGPEWNPVEGEFLCLKFLLIKHCYDLVNWNANSSHFPCLEKLVLGDLRKLEEIPLDIGEIPTLGSIKLLNCNYCTMMSAKNLLDEQVKLGNENLVVCVEDVKDIEIQKLATHNFQVLKRLNFGIKAAESSMLHFFSLLLTSDRDTVIKKENIQDFLENIHTETWETASRKHRRDKFPKINVAPRIKNKNKNKKKSFPQALEDTGKKIARNCKGLTLSIILIGGRLAKSERPNSLPIESLIQSLHQLVI